MKIELVGCAGPQPLTFGQLNQGEAYRRPHGEAIYIKAYGSKTGPRAVLLSTGECYWIPDSQPVVRINAKVVVEP